MSEDVNIPIRTTRAGDLGVNGPWERSFSYIFFLGCHGLETRNEDVEERPQGNPQGDNARDGNNGKRNRDGVNEERNKEKDKRRKRFARERKKRQKKTFDTWHIMHWNVNGFRRYLELNTFKEHVKRPHIICLNETKMTDNDGTYILPGYQKYDNNREDKYGGAAIFVRNDIHEWIEPGSYDTSLPDQVWVKTEVKVADRIGDEGSRLAIGSVYLPPENCEGWPRLKKMMKGDPMKKLEEHVGKLGKTHDILICSDTNAHTGTEQGCLNAIDDWGQPEVTVEGEDSTYRISQCKSSTGINARGKTLLGILERNGLHILNGMVIPHRRGTNRGTMYMDSTNTNYVMRKKRRNHPTMPDDRGLYHGER